MYIGKALSYCSLPQVVSTDSMPFLNYKAPNASVLNLGISDQIHYLCLKLKNNTSEDNLFIQSDNSSLTLLDVYQQVGDSLQLLGRYGKKHVDYRKMSSNVLSIPIQLVSGDSSVFYFKSYSILGASFPFRLQTHHSLEKAFFRTTAWGGVFFGAIIVMLFYNLFIYFQIKDLNYLRYVFYVSGVILYIGSFKGYIPFLFNLEPTVRIHLTYFLCNYASIVGVVFGYCFLVAGGLPKWLKLAFYGVLSGALLSLVLYFIKPQTGFNVFYINTLLIIFVLTLMAVKSYIDGYKPALYYLYGQIIMFVGIGLSILRVFGIVPFNFFTFHLTETGTFFDVIIFSLALASRIKSLDEEKNKSQRKLLELEQDNKSMLEATVEERTKELNYSLRRNELLLREVHHRVKNNLQMISSLLNLQADRVKDEQVLKVLTDSKNRIKSMAIVHQKLYHNNNNYHLINLSEYVNTLVEEIDLSFNELKKNISTDVRVDVEVLDIDNAVSLGLIINELLTNSYKHAFKDSDEGKISLELVEESKNSSLVLLYGDTGPGVNHSVVDANSFGITIIKMLVDEMNAEINFNHQDRNAYLRIIFHNCLIETRNYEDSNSRG